MQAAREEAFVAAAEYRAAVRDAVSQWRAEGTSLRQCASRIGVTEGALRDLLRPEGTSKNEKRR